MFALPLYLDVLTKCHAIFTQQVGQCVLWDCTLTRSVERLSLEVSKLRDSATRLNNVKDVQYVKTSYLIGAFSLVKERSCKVCRNRCNVNVTLSNLSNYLIRGIQNLKRVVVIGDVLRLNLAHELNQAHGSRSFERCNFYRNRIRFLSLIFCGVLRLLLVCSLAAKQCCSWNKTCKLKERTSIHESLLTRKVNYGYLITSTAKFIRYTAYLANSLIHP